MTKYLLLLCVLLSGALRAQDLNSFEAELKMLEENEESAFLRAVAITEKESGDQERELVDEVSIRNAGVKKEDIQQERSDIIIPPPVVKARRIRSR